MGKVQRAIPSQLTLRCFHLKETTPAPNSNSLGGKTTCASDLIWGLLRRGPQSLPFSTMHIAIFIYKRFKRPHRGSGCPTLYDLFYNPGHKMLLSPSMKKFFLAASILAASSTTTVLATTCVRVSQVANASWTNAARESCTWTGTVGSNFGINAANGGDYGCNGRCGGGCNGTALGNV